MLKRSKNMKLHLIRHAETNANSKGKLSCSDDEPLNENGFKQAELLKEYLSTIDFTELWCSPLLRARQTIQPFAKGRDIIIEPLLREGQLNLSAEEDVIIENRFEREESIPMFRGRCKDFIDKVQASDEDQVIVAITHGHFIREFLNLSLGVQNYTRFPVGNVSDTLIEFGEHPIVHYVNSTPIRR